MPACYTYKMKETLLRLCTHCGLIVFKCAEFTTGSVKTEVIKTK